MEKGRLERLLLAQRGDVFLLHRAIFLLLLLLGGQILVELLVYVQKFGSVFLNVFFEMRHDLIQL